MEKWEEKAICEETPSSTSFAKFHQLNAGTVHFFPGNKYPMLVFKGYQYKVGKMCGDTTVWLCTGYPSHKCKARLSTCKDTICLRRSDHTHQPIRRSLTVPCFSKVLKITHKPARRRSPWI
ncbi:hypothetical protein Trydic_g6520 [Trypoxylus dichotomus]